MENEAVKFNLGDEVYVLYNNKIQAGSVIGVYKDCQTFAEDPTTKELQLIGLDIRYKLRLKCSNNYTFPSSEVFATKEELVEHLLES